MFGTMPYLPLQDKPGTRPVLQERAPPDPCLLSPALRFSPSETFSPAPVTPRTVDRMFSHLPLHSQDQARMPYHMIPIGGIQMVQLRPRSRPKLERHSSSTPSPTSPKEDSPFFPVRRDFPWISLPETIPQRTQSRGDGTSLCDPSCPSTSLTLPKPSPLEQCAEQQTATVRKKYGASGSDSHSCGSEKSMRVDKREDKISHEVISSQETRQTGKPVAATLRGRGSPSDGCSGR